MSQVLAIANQKGGVGKTTTAINLVAALAVNGRRVLLVDLDPQGNATTGVGLNKRHLKKSIYEVLSGRVPITEAVVPIVTPTATFKVLPATRDLTAAEVALTRSGRSENCLREHLALMREAFDDIVIDCPPALNVLTVNALVAADAVLIPIQCEYYALEGLSSLLGTIQEIQRDLNPALRIDGLLRTMFDARSSLNNEVSSELLVHFGEQVYRTVIPRNVRLAEAPSHGIPALSYDIQSRGALAYLALASERLERLADSGKPGPVPGSHTADRMTAPERSG
ncbi:sporulation initiation inhibitor protein Soj [mine drainage metagenome]|uniref:Sporulation initiation inhibitor protein Soj n=1 Tax=mine drainage metagenome TaxID=410659 RepID=T1C373_9ZZZZ